MTRKSADEIETVLKGWISARMRRLNTLPVWARDNALGTFAQVAENLRVLLRGEQAEEVLVRCRGGPSLYKVLEAKIAEYDLSHERGAWQHELPASLEAAVFREAGVIVTEIRDTFREWCGHG